MSQPICSKMSGNIAFGCSARQISFTKISLGGGGGVRHTEALDPQERERTSASVTQQRGGINEAVGAGPCKQMGWHL